MKTLKNGLLEVASMAGVFSRKSPEAILREAESSGDRLRRVLGPVHITLFGIGAIIGAGIFAAVGTAAAGDLHRLGAGPSLMLSFILAGIVCAFAAFCYSEFASMVPISGSAYTYTYATLGEVVAWMIGWDLIIEYGVGNIAVAISWSNYFKTFLRQAGIIIPDWLCTDFRTATKIPGLVENAPHLFGVPIVFNLLAFAIVATLTVILLIGIRESAWFNATMVVIKLIVLSFFVYMGARYLKVDNWEPFMPNGIRGTLSGAAVIFFAYIGFDAVSTVAEETKDPQRNLPIGIIASLLICTVIYVIVAAVFTGMIPYSELSKTLSTEQAEPLTLALKYCHVPGIVVFVVAFGAIVAQTAVLCVLQMGQPRIFFSMARDGLLPKSFAKVHPRFRTPWWATIVTGTVVGLISMMTSLDEMVDLTNVGTLFAFILVCIGIVVLRVREPERKRAFRVPGGLVLPILCVMGCLTLVYYLPPTSWLRFAAWLNIGFLVYVTYGSVHSRLTGVAAAESLIIHRARSAYSGAWLCLLGSLLVMIARIADVVRLGAGAPSEWFFTNSWWLTGPLCSNALLVCPTIIVRALRGRAASGDDRRRAHEALLSAMIQMVVILAYLVRVWF